MVKGLKSIFEITIPISTRPEKAKREVPFEKKLIEQLKKFKPKKLKKQKNLKFSKYHFEDLKIEIVELEFFEYSSKKKDASKEKELFVKFLNHDIKTNPVES